jgi:hypothetical protein
VVAAELKIGQDWGRFTQVGNCNGRTFANHWELVRFAQEQHLDLDFTAPPKRTARP